MIAFASLLLGLVLGQQPIELVVEGGVAKVEVVLDGGAIGTLTAAQWTLDVDLGPELRPHLLEARGLDAAGRLVATARQWVNLPREPAEAALVLEGDDPLRPDRARLVWRHLEYASAESIAATLDGAPLPVRADGAIALPAYDPARVHLLAAELAFADGARYRAEVSFGGPGGIATDAELTGVPVVASGRAPPTVETIDGWLRQGGEVLAPVAVEKSPARVVMVVDPGAIAPLRELGRRGGALVSSTTAMRSGEEVQFLFPSVQRVARKDVATRLFSMSQPFNRRHGSFAWVLTRVAAPPAAPFKRLTDAVAVAGLHAAGGARPRAVVLVVGPRPDDQSAYGTAEVRRYLEELRVPLLVWSTGQPGQTTISEDRRPLTVSTPWGQATDVGSISRILRAVEGLRGTLDDQYIVWVEGSRLPGRIALAPAAKGLRLAGVIIEP